MPGVCVCLTTGGGLGGCEAVRMSEKQPEGPHTAVGGKECDSLLKSLQATLTHMGTDVGTGASEKERWAMTSHRELESLSVTPHKSLITFKKYTEETNCHTM